MAADQERRQFIGTGAAITAGLALGAFSRESLAADPKNLSAETFIGRYDSRLDDTGVRKLIAGQTIMGVTYKGSEYLAYFDPNGTVDKMIDVRRDQGRWSVQDRRLGFDFPKLAGGKPFALEIYRYRNGVLHKGWSPQEKRWTWFVVEPGKAKEFG